MNCAESRVHDAMREALSRVLRTAGVSRAPALDRVAATMLRPRRGRSDLRLTFTFHAMARNPDCPQMLQRDVTDLASWDAQGMVRYAREGRLTADAQVMYSRLFEDERMHRELADVRWRARNQLNYETSPGVRAAILDNLREMERHILQNHTTLYTSTQDNAVRAQDLNEATRQQAYEQLAGLCTEREFRDRNVYERQIQQHWMERGSTVDPGMDFWGHDPKVEARARELLEQHLTPAQKVSLAKHKHFEVKGGDTGKTYRIKEGRQMNIFELDAEGKEVQGWCFLPAGNLVAADCMLAQKTALELRETEALKKANQFGPGASVWVTINTARYSPQFVGRLFGVDYGT